MRKTPGISDLERKWRRVSSTHTLQELLEEDPSGGDPPRSNRAFLSGCLLFVLGTTIVAATGRCCMAAARDPSLRRDLYRSPGEDVVLVLILPAILPTLYVAALLNWASLKVFRHNA